MTSPNDLVALVARLRAFTASYSEMQACAAAIEQLQAELADCHRVITIWDASDLKARPAVEQYARAERAETERDVLRAELAACKEDVSELRALDNEAQHGADALRAELAAANLALKLKPRPYADADLLIVERDAARTELALLRSLEEVAEADSLARAIAASEANCDVLRAELAVVKRDAERWRFLSRNVEWHDYDDAGKPCLKWTPRKHPDWIVRDVDAAIDAARAQAGGE